MKMRLIVVTVTANASSLAFVTQKEKRNIYFHMLFHSAAGY